VPQKGAAELRRPPRDFLLKELDLTAYFNRTIFFVLTKLPETSL
jgi:hypothetical protein